jgi:SAM-dependent methyltransferase
MFFRNLYGIFRFILSGKSIKAALREEFRGIAEQTFDFRGDAIREEFRNRLEQALNAKETAIRKELLQIVDSKEAAIRDELHGYIEAAVKATAKTPSNLVDDFGRPSGFADAINKIDFISHNCRVLAKYAAGKVIKEIDSKSVLKPQAVPLNCKLATQADFESDWGRYWLKELKIPFSYNRKFWEWAYITQVLFEAEALTYGKRGLGLGCGTEPLPCFFASTGCHIVAGDQPPSNTNTTAWSDNNEYTESIDSLYKSEYMSRDDFDERVSLKYIDMNKLPEDLYGMFDFCWSSCVVEHLGSIRNGLDFLKNSVKLLKPGGVSVHTIEFNYLDAPLTLDNCSSNLFKRSHMESLREDIANVGVMPLFDFSVGEGILDKYIDMPPFPFANIPGLDVSAARIYPSGGTPHIKLWLYGFPTTSFGLIIKRSK